MLLKNFPSKNVYYILIREKIIIEKEKGNNFLWWGRSRFSCPPSIFIFDLIRIFFSGVIFSVVIPTPKIVKNLLINYEKLHCKTEQYRFIGWQDPLIQTQRDPVTLLK